MKTLFQLVACVALSTIVSGQELDAIAADAFPPDEPGAAVIVVRDGDVLLRKGYGMADLELGVPITPDMVFRIGSVTKQFTAAAILLLEQQGKLSVEDDITKHLPRYPTEGETITIEHLLTHTSGIRSYTDMDSFSTHMRSDLSLDELIDEFEDEPLAFAPGEKYAYNNSGYVLLGAIIENVSGMSYAAFVERHIFEPLAMRQSRYGSPTKIIQKRAKGYQQTPVGFENASYLSMTLPHAAGALLSTVDDLAAWDRALYATELLSQASLGKWWRPFRIANGASTHYGYGWGVSSYEGRPVVAHGGGINGFSCYVLRMPEDRVFVAVLTNRSARGPAPSLVAKKLAAAAIGQPIAEPSPVEVAPDVLEGYVGVYRVDADARHEITFDDGKLYLRRFGDEHPEGGRVRNPGPSERLNRVREELHPASSTEFFVEDSLVRVRFDDEDLVVASWDHEERSRKTDLPLDAESAVLATIQKLFDGMTAQDTRVMRSVLDPGARIVQTFTREGVPTIRTVSVSEFLDRIAEHDGPTLVERTWGPRVHIEDNLATVWLSYEFYIGDELDHCGEDAFQLAKTNLGWKIIAAADTQRREGCDERTKE